ncbi:MULTISPECIES: acyl-CoA dehydrogenase family protein [unclassified Mycobacterium]|uniref:acyl-CoA dehydrogenase family protein n=1 Tax=unclassified Mycobacterium TaxID=2642494 RepID=UPI0029C89CC7|nr:MULTISPECIES: acyl-CoA dehydrogenase family protein [unclassified Mycobacterium]
MVKDLNKTAGRLAGKTRKEPMENNIDVRTFAGPVDEKWVQEAAALVPQLRASAEKGEELERLPDETVDALEAAGLLSLMTPRAHGGEQASLATIVAALTELAKGCGSTAWVASVYTTAPAFLSLLPDPAQEAVYTSDNKKTFVVFSAKGSARHVDGGYRLDGTAAFGSGQHHAGWGCMFATTIREDGDEDIGFFLLPKSSFQVADDWKVSGMCATGSNSVVAEDVFVPTEHSVLLSSLLMGEVVPSDPYYQAPIGAFLAAAAATPIGLARSALDLLTERIHKRGITYMPYSVQAEAPITHLQVAEATMLFDEACFHADRAMAGVSTDVGLGDLTSSIQRQADVSRAFDLCREVVTIAQKASGASAIRRDNPLQRIARDIQAIALHSRLLASSNMEVYGALLCGQPAMPMIL